METGLKQRLVGASVIIALAVIFIPMLFDNSKDIQNQSITINIPDEPENLKQKVINIDTGQFVNAPVSDEKPIIKDETNENTNNSETNTSLPIIKKEETILDVVDNTKHPKENNISSDQDIDNDNSQADLNLEDDLTETDNVDIKDSNNKDSLSDITTDGQLNTYRVKFGVFSQQKNAQQLKAKIINSGYSAIVEENEETNQYTVYSQLLESEIEAKVMSESIQKINLNIGKPTIQSLNEEDSIAAEAMLDTGWIIQIGSFASKVNSIKLRDKIRNKGFVTFVDEITNSKQDLRYRVRIGPYATRDEAQVEQINIKKAMNLDGIIKPHEKQKVITQ